MFIAVTRIALPPEQLEQMAEAFRRSAPDLKQFDGFLGLELWRDGESLQAVSRWESRAAMETYQRSEAFRAHHGGGAPSGQPHGHDAARGAGSHPAHGGPSSSAHYDAEVVV
jgi:heme-degrading monooxygenase HmoA